jgi:hypothetical protein
MFKAHRGIHFTTWFHWNSQEFEMGTKGWKEELTAQRNGERDREFRGVSPERRAGLCTGSPEDSHRGGEIASEGGNRPRQR